MDPVSLFNSEEFLAKIEAVCRRHFSAENDRNECCVFVIDSLQADSFKRLRAFQGKSKLTTYLYSLVNSLVIDFKRKKFGRRRIPTAVVKLGKWAEMVYRLVCWQRFSFDDAYDLLRVDGLFAGTYLEFIREAEPIRRAPCRENPTFQPLDETRDNSLPAGNEDSSNPLESLIRKLDRERRIRALKIIRQATTELAETDQLLIRLVYGSDRPVSAAAKAVGLPVSTAGKRLKHLLTEFREKLLAEGIREP